MCSFDFMQNPTFSLAVIFFIYLFFFEIATKLKKSKRNFKQISQFVVDEPGRESCLELGEKKTRAWQNTQCT